MESEELKPEDITPKTFPKPQLHPLLAILPPLLKDPANYQKIRKAILETFISTCDHSEIGEWAKCRKCQNKMDERRLLLRRLGFKNPKQYMLWQRTHEEVSRRMPLINWKLR